MVSGTLVCCLLIALGLGVSDAYTVAFSAAKSGHQYSSTRMVYNKVYLNSGRGYHSNSGIFVAPECGIYSFTFNFLAYPSHVGYMYLYKNSAIVSRGMAYVVSYYINGGNTVNIYLHRGDKVWTKNSGYIYGGYYTTFSGYLIPAQWDRNCDRMEKGTIDQNEDVSEGIDDSYDQRSDSPEQNGDEVPEMNERASF